MIVITFALILFLIFAITLNVYSSNIENSDIRFKVAYELKNCVVYYDKETNVQYLMVNEQGSRSLTLLVDSEGKPLLYDIDE